MAKALSQMSLEELQEKQHNLTDRRDEIQEELLEIAAEADKRLAQLEAAKLLENASDDVKRALHQSISAQGILSEEGVGTPG